MANECSVSVVITSYSEDRLPDMLALLDSVRQQEYRHIEAIYVVERSARLAEALGAYARERGMPDFRLVMNDGESGLSASRNLGARHATGDIIAFVDDDTVLLPGWAEAMVRAYEDESVIGATGPALPLWEDEAMSWFPEEFYWLITCTAWTGWDSVREVRNGWGMNMSFRRDVFDKGEFFSTAFGLHDSQRPRGTDPPSEDVDLSLRVKKRLGGRIVFVPGAAVKHRVYRWRLSSKFLVQRAYSVGYQRRMLKRLYPDNGAGDLMAAEHDLLRRILTRLVPGSLRRSLTHPIAASRELGVTALVLGSVATGYIVPFAIPLPSARKTSG